MLAGRSLRPNETNAKALNLLSALSITSYIFLYQGLGHLKVDWPYHDQPMAALIQASSGPGAAALLLHRG